MNTNSEQPCSVVALIGTTLLSSHKVLTLVQSTPFQQVIRNESLREAVYLGYLPWSSRHPDHVFDSGWQLLAQHQVNEGQPHWVPGVLLALAGEFLEPRHGALHVKRDNFGAWQQSILSRISGIPVQAASQVREKPRAYLTGLILENVDSQTWASEHVPILSPYDSLVEDYLSREGLHETHLHLNGSTHAEGCWLRALRAPKAETLDFNKKWTALGTREAIKIRELALAINPALSPAELHRQLVAAGRLRQWLIAAATDCIADNTKLPFDYAELTASDSNQNPIPRPGDCRLELSDKSCVADELYWMRLLLQRLISTPSVVLERMLHCYLLLQNHYYRLLVQSEEQFGFDQFQKLTFTDLREPAEKEYLNRFLSMHGKHTDHSRTGYLEGRFAPKQTLRKNYLLLQSILGGYWHYLHKDQSIGRRAPSLRILLEELKEQFQRKSPLDRSHQRLALVVHFIKQPWSASPVEKAGSYRFYKQRSTLEHSANVLIETLVRWPGLRTWVRGIDAAANELDTPPEVFASIYRVCQQAGLTRRSYHVGEDFPHLLTGLRNMLDALELLDLRDGDRIGHGTAMGILPQLWLDRMPGELVVRNGEWMLDLLAAWRLLRRLPGSTAEAYRVEFDLTALASYVFGRNISVTAFERAMRFRDLNMRFLQCSREAAWSLNLTPFHEFWHAEALRVQEARLHNPCDLDLLWEWQNDRDLWSRSEDLQEVDAAYFDSSTYLLIQQALMSEVAERGVVIETLPSSNVRISQYLNFSEHHALRWMRVPGCMQECDPEIMTSLGSDDPGIFAGDLNGEFYQLFAALRNRGLTDKTALAYLAPVNERGRQYGFHDSFIG